MFSNRRELATAFIVATILGMSLGTQSALGRPNAVYDLRRETPRFPFAQRALVLSYEDELVRGLRRVLDADFNPIPADDRPVPANTTPPTPSCAKPDEAGIVSIRDDLFLALSPARAPDMVELDVVLYDCQQHQRAWIRIQSDYLPKRKENLDDILRSVLESNMQRALGALILKLAPTQ